MIIVPNALREAILEKLDAAIEKCPGAVGERDALYHQLLAYYDEHGIVPDITLEKKARP